MIEIDERTSIDEGELAFHFARSGGPGGQNVNKVSTKAELRWKIAESRAIGEDAKQRLTALAGRRLNAEGELIVVCGRHRSQVANREECVERLVELVRRSLRPPKRRQATRPSAASKAGRIEEKRRRAGIKRARRRPDVEE